MGFWDWLGTNEHRPARLALERLEERILLACAVELVSISGGGGQCGGALSMSTSISADGRYVAFDSNAPDIVPGDTNGGWDIFLYDRQTGVIECLSISAVGALGDGNSYGPRVSADGRYVAFESEAANLVPGDTNGCKDVFVHDCQTGLTERVSVSSSGIQANGTSNGPSISSDGRHVAFCSTATNLISDDTNGLADIFVYDRQTGVVERVSVSSAGVQSNGSSGQPSISEDGWCVAFTSGASNLVAGDANGMGDIFVYDRQTDIIELISVSTGGAQGNSSSLYPSISANGRCVAFASWSSNLVAGDTNGLMDVFVHDRQAGVTERVSVSSSGVESNGWSEMPSVNADGRYVAFQSTASNLISDFTGGMQIYVYDRDTDTIERASVSSAGFSGMGSSRIASISADGRYVAFDSSAFNLVVGDTNAAFDVFVRDRQASLTERVSLCAAGVQADDGSYHSCISADGRYVAFESLADNLVPGDSGQHRDIFVYDRETGAVERVSVSSAGIEADLDSWSPSISADGRYVAFDTAAGNLVAGDTNYRSDVFVYDRETDTIERVSVSSAGGQGDQASSGASISGDGRYVAFRSLATNLVPGDTNGCSDVFVYDRQTDTLELVSVPSGGGQADRASYDACISADGRCVAFSSDATNLVVGDTGGMRDVFVYDRQTGMLERVSISSGGAEGDSSSECPSIGADGRYVAFESSAANLVPEDTNDGKDIFVYDRQTDTIERVSVSSAGVESNGWCYGASISGDGRYVTYVSYADNLAPGDAVGYEDVFLYDRQNGTAECVSVCADGGQADSGSTYPSISADGRFVAFTSYASNLVPGDVNSLVDILVGIGNTMPTMLLGDPAPATRVNPGDVYAISWTDFDPDHSAVIALCWDTDTNPGNNTLPDQGVTWGSIATGVSEDDPANSLDWTVDAPAPGRYYLYGEIDNAVGFYRDYAGRPLYVNAPPSIGLDEPVPGNELSPGNICTVTWTDGDLNDDASVALYWDVDTDSSNNTGPNEGIAWGTIATGISENSPANTLDWIVDAPAPGDYYLYAVIDDGLATASDYTSGTLYVNAPPSITVGDPPPGSLIAPGQVYTITWTVSDPDDDAVVALYWDTDTVYANNAPGTMGTSWDVIATGLSEAGPNSCVWTANVPAGRDYYLYAVAEDGLASVVDYAGTPVLVTYHLIDSRLIDGATVSVYDVDASNGLSAPTIAWFSTEKTVLTDVYVNAGTIGDGVINAITFYGDGSRTKDLLIVVEDNAKLTSVLDSRKVATPLGGVVSEGPVGTISLKSGLIGACLNGFTAEGGWVLPSDIDGDGDSDDLTAVYVAGAVPTTGVSLGTLTAKGDVNGDIVSGKKITSLRITGADLNGDVKAGQDLRGLSIGTLSVARGYVAATRTYVGGSINGDITASGNVTSVRTTGGGMAGDLTVGGKLGSLTVSGGDFAGSIDVDGAVSTIRVAGLSGVGGNLSGSVTVGGKLTTLSVTGGDLDADVSVGADALGSSIGTISAARGYISASRTYVGGSISGSIEAGGKVSAIRTTGGGMAADVTVTGDLGSLTVSGGDLTGDVSVSGAVSSIRVSKLTGVGGNVNADISVGGKLGTLSAAGNVGGIIDVGSLTSLTVSGGNLMADVTVDGVLSSLRVTALTGVGGNFAGNVTVLGNPATGNALNSISITGNWQGNLTVPNGKVGTVSVGGSIVNSQFDIGRDFASLLTKGSITDSLLEAGGLWRTVNVSGNFTNSSVNAGLLATVTVKGSVSGTGGDDEIHALSGIFSARDAAHTTACKFQLGVEDVWDGVHLYVG